MTDASTKDGKPGVLRLAVSGLSKRYGAVQALDGAELELRPGEIMALLGENGAGKSTMVKVLAGLVVPDAGEVMLDGEGAAVFPVAASRQAGIAVVHQEFSLVPTMSVAENLALESPGPWIGIWWPPTLRKQARRLLRRVGLEDLDPRTPVSELTVAERQLLEIARVLHRDARVVIFDEPTAALSDADVPRVLKITKSLAAEGRSVIYVTHRLPEVFEIAGRVTVIRNGRSLPPAEVGEMTPDRVVEMILGRAVGAMFPDRPTEVGGEVLLEAVGVDAPGLAEPLDLSARAGEILGLTGQLGSGASAAIEVLAGTLPKTAGEVLIRGESVGSVSRRAGVRRGIAYCTADRKHDGIFDGKSITQNLSSAWLDRVSRNGFLRAGEEKRRAAAAAEGFALDPKRLGSLAGNLSGGNQQKVALGKWLGIDPLVLLVEEPTRGVDIGARAEIYTRLRALADAGAAVIVASSDTAEIHGLCDTIATFYRGRLTARKPAARWSPDELTFEVMHSREGVLT